MLNGHPGDVTVVVKRAIIRGVNHGLIVTSTTDGVHATNSWHETKPLGKAVDMAGPGIAAEVDYQRDLIRGLGASRFNEIFGPDNFANVKNGQVITLIEGSGLEELHDTHIHIAPRWIPKLRIPQIVKDRLLARKLKRQYGATWAFYIIRYARKHRIPLAWALALVEQESNFKNIFGCDHGRLPNPSAPPFCRVSVTTERVSALLRWVASGRASNGVGLTQLTSVNYIQTAQRRGGAHKPKVQLDVGFEVFRSKTGGDWSKAWKYNGDPRYQPQIATKHQRWVGRLS